MRNKHEQRKELILLIGGLLIVIVCIITVAILICNYNDNNKNLPEYAITFFTSITTLILGYLFGKFIGGKR